MIKIVEVEGFIKKIELVKDGEILIVVPTDDINKFRLGRINIDPDKIKDCKWVKQ